MKLQNLMFAAVGVIVTIAGSTNAQAGSRYEVDAARRAANSAWYQVKLSRGRLGKLGRQGFMAKSWNNLYSQAVKKSPGRYAARQKFMADLNTLSRHSDDVINKANAAIRAYSNRYSAEYRWYSKGNPRALQSLRQRRDQDIKAMQILIDYSRRGRDNARRYWLSHLSKLPR